jgi:flagellar biosynthesis/type III secretory pathway chaperone
MTLPTTQLADLIRRKHAVLVQLCEVGRRQKDVVERGETTALLELLAAKQTMITLLQQVERDLAPFQSEHPDARVWESPEARTHCAAQAVECNQLLAAVVELERHCAEQMTVRRNDVAAQLKHVVTAGQARSAYEAHR